MRKEETEMKTEKEVTQPFLNERLSKEIHNHHT